MKNFLRKIIFVSLLASFFNGSLYAVYLPKKDVAIQTDSQNPKFLCSRLAFYSIPLVIVGVTVAVQYLKDTFAPTVVEPEQNIESQNSFEPEQNIEPQKPFEPEQNIEPQKPFVESLPPEGPFKRVCTSCTFTKNLLTCRCPQKEDLEKRWVDTSLMLPCEDGSVVVEYANNALTCVYDRIKDRLKDKPCQKNLNQEPIVFDGVLGCHYPIPGGDYKNSCYNCAYEKDDVLSCSCRDENYRMKNVKVQMPCGDNSLCLENDNGNLQCVYKSTIVNASGLIVR